MEHGDLVDEFDAPCPKRTELGFLIAVKLNIRIDLEGFFHCCCLAVERHFLETVFVDGHGGVEVHDARDRLGNALEQINQVWRWVERNRAAMRGIVLIGFEGEEAGNRAVFRVVVF